MVIVTHANHANEIDNDVKLAMSRLDNAGVTLLNQSVLLNRVNDSKDALVQLSYALFESRILPYYLHQLDKVRGASHFSVDDDIAGQLMESLRKELPGYLLPRLVREIPGQPSKLPII